MINDIITRITEDQDIRSLGSLNKKILYEHELKLYMFLEEFYNNYRTLPSKERCIQEDVEYSYLFTDRPEVSSPVLDLIARFTKQRVWDIAEQKFNEQKLVKASGGTYDFDDITEFLDRNKNLGIVTSKFTNIGEFDRATYYKESHKTSVPIGIRIIDQYGGLQKSDYVIFAAKQKTLKSTLISMITKSLYLGGHKILFINREMSVDQLIQKIDAYLGEFDSNAFLKRSEQDYKVLQDKLPIVEYKHQIAKKNGGSIYIAPAKAYEVDEIDTMLQYFENTGNRIDFLIVDGIHLLSDEGSLGRKDYKAMASISTKLRDLALTHDLRLIGTTHIQPRIAPKMSYSSEDLAYHTGLATDVTALLAIGEVLDEPVSPEGYSKFFIEILENRFGKSNKVLKQQQVVAVDFEKSAIYDVSYTPKIHVENNLGLKAIMKDTQEVKNESDLYGDNL